MARLGLRLAGRRGWARRLPARPDWTDQRGLPTQWPPIAPWPRGSSPRSRAGGRKQRVVVERGRRRAGRRGEGRQWAHDPRARRRRCRVLEELGVSAALGADGARGLRWPRARITAGGAARAGGPGADAGRHGPGAGRGGARARWCSRPARGTAVDRCGGMYRLAVPARRPPAGHAGRGASWRPPRGHGRPPSAVSLVSAPSRRPCDIEKCRRWARREGAPPPSSGTRC